MRYLLAILIIAICLTGYSQTQAEMNRNASELYKKIDKELNDIYKAILTEYKSDTVFIKNLNVSQRIWITFRDAELKVKFPETDPGFYGKCISNVRFNLFGEINARENYNIKRMGRRS